MGVSSVVGAVMTIMGAIQQAGQLHYSERELAIAYVREAKQEQAAPEVSADLSGFLPWPLIENRRRVGSIYES